uniref:(northern house mosquito) hypothetical protein n=1 Tax=Culex pipiens TaxID=7175 RepID=A0A8D8K8Z3_CULPI
MWTSRKVLRHPPTMLHSSSSASLNATIIIIIRFSQKLFWSSSCESCTIITSSSLNKRSRTAGLLNTFTSWKFDLTTFSWTKLGMSPPDSSTSSGLIAYE